MLNNKKTKFAVSLIAAAMAASTPAQAEVSDYLDRLEVNFLAMQNFQSIQAKDGAFRPEDEEQSSGFGRIRANLMLKFHINEFITADIDIAEEPNDFGGGDRDFSFHNDYAGVEFDLLGLTDNLRENENLTLRLGNIGGSPFQFKGFQDGADNQANALIGNGMTDYATAENGAQLSYTKSYDSGLIRSYNVTGHITTSSFGEAFQEDRGYNYRLQGTLEFEGGFKAGLNYLQANQGDQLRFENGVASLDGVTTTNYRFGDGENYNFSASPSSERDTHVGVMPGLDQTTIQLNLAYQPTSQTSVILMLGKSSDDFTFADSAGNAVAGITYFGNSNGVADANGTTYDSNSVIEGESSVQYYVVEAQQYIIPEKLYVAARYAEAENTSDLISQDDNTVERLQVAAGYWFNDSTLLKVEYVNQEEGANSGGQIGTGFDGFTSEISVKF
ncbi:hypothetical protein PC2016_1565 [Pseudoalteromonas carrageenovora]|uniref:Porin n=1 Tax=Pseudoalteromonas carrageenovora IAM 12662 TaxID=1314868 RepID=A0A2K4X978_PSEVC|nr:hypothetical protein [Pseudoalteromonas carrageenovora]MBE0383217.1 hypothetical protein [Pseudoalteromonas carrageenovora IAM 12662]MCQ8888269.1 hypothetical protein [Pseudoalteromonas carrageenovora]MDO6546018.1 hypothetical protein [Pseudoalteromonas carrageenovora]MDO6636084.1 hypothetical protein [Pseudoalteromonas carrageenovora]MDO6646897.1 hypothetical protein [Pseudoalteromonas carrageenovora]